eukprot:g6371.t1
MEGKVEDSEAMQFRITNRVHRTFVDQVFPYFCLRDFQIDINKANQFYPTLMGFESQRINVLTTSPINTYNTLCDSKIVWKNFFILMKKFHSINPQYNTESFDMQVKTVILNVFSTFALAFWKIYKFDSENNKDIFETLKSQNNMFLHRQFPNMYANFLKKNVNDHLKWTLFGYLSFQNGQKDGIRYADKIPIGQLGSYRCYNMRSQMSLCSLEVIDKYLPTRGAKPWRFIVFAVDYCELQPGVRKCYYIDQDDRFSINIGWIVERGGYQVIPVHQIMRGYDFSAFGETEHPGSPLMKFFQTFSSKLENGFYQIDSMNGGISLFPTSGRYFTNCVTRNNYFPKGISVSSSTIPLPGTNMGWAYSIRIKVVPDPDNRRRCQLVSRHWRIGYSNGRIEHVDGPGVVGKFPVFTTHGTFISVEPNIDDQLHLVEHEPGVEFIYESCTGTSDENNKISFGGHLTFRLVPDHEKQSDHIAYNDREIDRGDGLFQVEVKNFPIDNLESVKWVL